jgi:hypothetical protein
MMLRDYWREKERIVPYLLIPLFFLFGLALMAWLHRGPAVIIVGVGGAYIFLNGAHGMYLRGVIRARQDCQSFIEEMQATLYRFPELPK